MRKSWVLLATFLLLVCSTVSAAPFGNDELDERASIADAASQAFIAADLVTLENQSQQYRSSEERTQSGIWKLTIFYSGLRQAIRNAPDAKSLNKLELTSRKWASLYPKSPTAHITNSSLWIERAWTARGTDYGSSVNKKSWRRFKTDIAKARKNLDKYKDISSIDPQWYEDMLVIGKAEAWERIRFQSLLDEALQRSPLYYQNYFAGLEYFLPKWYGDVDAIDTFVQQAVSRTEKSEGQGMYARLYWYAAQAQFDSALFTSSQANWHRMKAGFNDVIAKHPDAWNLNNFAKFACLAHDKNKTKELSARIHGHFINDAWPSAAVQASCLSWAFGNGPAPTIDASAPVQAWRHLGGD